MSILVLGASGLLGNALFRVLSEKNNEQVFGTIRNEDLREFFIPNLSKNLLILKDATNYIELNRILDEISPKVVINCIALTKKATLELSDYISIYSIFPRNLSSICLLRNIRFINISSDGVFSGNRGNYTERDIPDATDFYGISKYLGESFGSNIVTLRTSIIGHELKSKSGILEWLLSQNNVCKGYAKYIFSGFPAIILSKIIRDEILTRPKLNGLFHLGSEPISKFNLLELIAEKYDIKVKIISDDQISINRSLEYQLFKNATGYIPPNWADMVDEMYSYKFGLERNYV